MVFLVAGSFEWIYSLESETDLTHTGSVKRDQNFPRSDPLYALGELLGVYCASDSKPDAQPSSSLFDDPVAQPDRAADY